MLLTGRAVDGRCNHFSAGHKLRRRQGALGGSRNDAVLRRLIIAISRYRFRLEHEGSRRIGYSLSQSQQNIENLAIDSILVTQIGQNGVGRVADVTGCSQQVLTRLQNSRKNIQI